MLGRCLLVSLGIRGASSAVVGVRSLCICRWRGFGVFLRPTGFLHLFCWRCDGLGAFRVGFGWVGLGLLGLWGFGIFFSRSIFLASGSLSRWISRGIIVAYRLSGFSSRLFLCLGFRRSGSRFSRLRVRNWG
ncbi:hypothetical protein F4779DRAFT_583798 [Xylariaceae sp. FL0662B]|nr:hypothetical protein F4779DRAFT_583798 [Xylariaceae sp. FL0662B]